MKRTSGEEAEEKAEEELSVLKLGNGVRRDFRAEKRREEETDETRVISAKSLRRQAGQKALILRWIACGPFTW